MKKIHSLLRFGFVLALISLIGGQAWAAYPAASTLDKKYSFSATVVYESTTTQKEKNMLPASGNITIKNNATAVDEESDWLGNEGTNVPISYDATTGTITLSTNSLGYLADFSGATSGWTFTMTTMDGSSTIKWYVNEAGNIIMPDFIVKSNGKIAATYTNCIVGGYTPTADELNGNTGDGDEGDEGDEDSDVVGTYQWTVKPVNTSTFGLEAETTITVQVTKGESENSYILSEVGSTSLFWGTEITFTATPAGDMTLSTIQTPSLGSGYTCTPISITTTPVQLQNSYMVKSSKFTPANGFTIGQDFGFLWLNMNTMDVKGGFGVIASTTVSTDEPDEPEEPEQDDITGNYTIYLMPIDLLGGTANTIEVQVAIAKAENQEGASEAGAYYTITEVGDGGYLPSVITFEYKDNNAYFNSSYAGQFDDKYTWFAVCAYTSALESMGECFIPFTKESGFSFKANEGFAWYITPSEDDFTPSDIYKAYLVKSAPEDGNGRYDDGSDEPGDDDTKPLIGDHTFKATLTYTADYANNTTIAGVLLSDFTFTITAGSVDNYLAASNTFGYTNADGVLTLSKSQVAFAMDYTDYSSYTLCIATADGEWVNAQTCNVPWEITADGHIVIPDFAIIDSNVASHPIVAYYTNCQVDGYAPEAPVSYPAAGEFDGTYTFKAGSYKFDGGPFTTNKEIDYSSYAANFPQEFEFGITTDDEGNITLKPFFVGMFNLNNGSQTNGDPKAIATTYDQETGVLTLKTYAVQPEMGINLGIAPEGEWGGITAATIKYMNVQITENGGIEFPDFNLIAYYGSNQKGNVVEYGNIVVTKAGEEEEPEPENYPEAGAFDGTYKFSAGSYNFDGGPFTTNKEIDYSSYAGNFPQEFEFSITTDDAGNISISPFFVGMININNGSQINGDPKAISTTYDQETGVLTFNTYAVQPAVGINLGIAPNGEWNGIGAAATKMQVQITKRGGIEFPDFNIIAYYGGTQKGNVVEYGDITVTKVTGSGEGDGGDETIYADPDIEGVWSFTLNDHYNGSESLKEFTAQYEATLNGNTVTFTPTDGDSHLIIGKFTDETTIEFSRVAVNSVIYPLYQVPYIFETSTNVMANLPEQTFSAIYNSGAGTLEFPENSGLKYGNFNLATGQLAYGEWDFAADFISASRDGEIPAEVTISRNTYTIGENSVTWVLNVETRGIDLTTTTWKATVIESFSSDETETDWEETTTLDVTVEDGIATLELTDLPLGNHDFKASLTAYDAEDNAIVTSNQLALTVKVGPDIMIMMGSDRTATVDKDAITVTFRVVNISGMPADVHYGANFITDVNDDQPDGIAHYTPASYDPETMLATATWNVGETGTFNFKVALVAYNSDDEILCQSNRIEYPTVTVDTVGIENIAVDGNSAARYFNLQGVEVKNPTAGNLYIRVEGNTATKVLVK